VGAPYPSFEEGNRSNFTNSMALRISEFVPSPRIQKSPRWYHHFIVVKELVNIGNLKGYASGSVGSS
jgi:hypothetical protein